MSNTSNPPNETFTDLYAAALTKPEKDTVVTFRVIASFLSLFGTLFIIISMVMFKKLSTFSHRLIFFLNVAQFGESVNNVLTIFLYEREEQLFGLCYAQGITMQFFEFSGAMWVVIISLNLYLVIVKNEQNVSDREKYFHIFAWGLAFISCLIPVMMTKRGYGLAGLWCWIIGELIPARFFLFYIPLYIMIAIVIIFYVLIVNRIFKHIENMDQDDKSKNRAREFQRKIIAYPIIFFILYIFPTINRIYDWLNEDDSFILYLLHATSSPLIGFINAIAYGFDDDLRNSWKQWLVFNGLCVNIFKEDTTDMNEALSSNSDMESISISDTDLPTSKFSN